MNESEKTVAPLYEEINLTDRQKERFWRKVLKTDEGCWEWTGAKIKGYGSLRIDKIHYYAHRISYLLAHGKIPVGLHICHQCDHPPCCNPHHLFVGSQHDNAMDKARKGRAPSKLKSDDVIEIRRLVAAGKIHREVAAPFNVTRSTVSFIISRKTWKHLP